jgi:hypothetical protein
MSQCKQSEKAAMHMLMCIVLSTDDLSLMYTCLESAHGVE